MDMLKVLAPEKANWECRLLRIYSLVDHSIPLKLLAFGEASKSEQRE